MSQVDKETGEFFLTALTSVTDCIVFLNFLSCHIFKDHVFFPYPLRTKGELLVVLAPVLS